MISKRISPEPGCPPSSREWFQVKPRSARVRVLPAVKTARWPPQGPAALPRQGDRRADAADGQLPGQEPATALSVATGACTPLAIGRRAAMGCRYPAAQNGQWCLAEKSVSICGWGGTSDSICALPVPSKAGQGTAALNDGRRAVIRGIFAMSGSSRLTVGSTCNRPV